MFDTAFHRSIPLAAAAYGGPRHWIDRGMGRYGFHGLSHQHAAHRAALLGGGGMGELPPLYGARILERFGFLGVVLDAAARQQLVAE